ncbi:MAG: hypothetical protein KVP17_004580, partial [Porospora cf. gigantea B]|uniref:uncharacterized protein n=1 Tax=Porospora cf. gigantea B TaxID=2853592 RepID=UPI0035719798
MAEAEAQIAEEVRFAAMARKLVDVEQDVRLESFKMVDRWLRGKGELSLAECLKLWKVFICSFWLADGPTIQREFALNVVILMRPSKGLIPRETLSTWMSAFWTVYQDDWDKLDR